MLRYLAAAAKALEQRHLSPLEVLAEFRATLSGEI